jgi:glycerol-3-phosphate acyltransferase PlsY
MVSAGSILAALALPVVVHLRQEPVPGLVWVGTAIALLVVVRHRGNVARILRGEEKRFRARGGAAAVDRAAPDGGDGR